MWLDTDVSNAIVTKAFLHDNVKDGIFVEANQGPITIEHSTICHNSEYGVRSANTARVTLANNIIYGNGASSEKTGAQIHISGDNGGRKLKDFETGQSTTAQSENWKLTDNQIVGTNTHQLLLMTTLNAPTWQLFTGSLSSDHNLWYNARLSDGFSGDSGGRCDSDAWKHYSGQDKASSFSDPRYKDADHHSFDPLP
jgi:hypothetical protein